MPAPLDLIFIDADKENYVNYYEALLKLAPTGLMIIDKHLPGPGSVADESVRGGSTEAIRRLNDRVLADDRVECVALTVRDGMLLIRRV